MSILKIIKLESGAFLHNDSIDGDFFLGKFYFKQEFNKAFIVETYGAKRRTYLVTEIKVFDFGGTEESFTNWTTLFNRLTTLGYNGIETNGLIPANIETTANKTDVVAGNETSSIKYPSVKGLVYWVTSLFVPKTRTLTIGGVTQDLSANRTFTVSAGELRQQFTTYGNSYNLSAIGNFYSSEVTTGLTSTTISNSPGNVLTSVMAIRWVMPLFNSDKSQKLKRFVIRTSAVQFSSFRVVIFMGQTLDGATSRINNIVIHDETISLTGNGANNVTVIERTTFTNDITIPQGYEVCYLISRLNGTNGTINNFQISGYAS